MAEKSSWARRGMMVAPHALAAQSGLAVLREGGNAIEAMIAAATVDTNSTRAVARQRVPLS